MQTSPKHQLQDENAGPYLAPRDARGGGCRFSVGRSRRVCVRRGSMEAGGRRFPGLRLLPQPPCCCSRQLHDQQTPSHHPTPRGLHFPSLTSQPPDYLGLRSRVVRAPLPAQRRCSPPPAENIPTPDLLFPSSSPRAPSEGQLPPQTRRRFSCGSLLRTAAGEAPFAPALPFHSPTGFPLPLLGNPATNPAPKPLPTPAENHGPVPALPAPLSRGCPGGPAPAAPAPRCSFPGHRCPLPGPRSPRADILLLAQLFPQLGSDVSVSGSCRNRRRRLDVSFVIFFYRQKSGFGQSRTGFARSRRSGWAWKGSLRSELGRRAGHGSDPASSEGPGFRITEVEA